MNKTRKHVLEFFKKDSWQVRVGVLVLWMGYMLILVGIASSATEELPRLALRLIGMR